MNTHTTRSYPRTIARRAAMLACVGSIVGFSTLTMAQDPGGDDSGRHGDDSGDHGDDSGRHGDDSGDHGDDSGRHDDDSGDHGDDSGDHGDDSGRHGDDSGDHGDDSGDHGDDSGDHDDDSGEYGDDSGDHDDDTSRHGDDQSADLPNEITLSGVVRDFRERNADGGHADFERRPSGGFGHYIRMVEDELDGRGLPVFRSTGEKVTSNWRDSQGRNIIKTCGYISSRRGDTSGSTNSGRSGSSTTSENFAMWFSDVPGVNSSAPLSLTLRRQPGSSVFTFDDREDDFYASRGGFFPINGEQFGNSAGDNKNFHFTYHLSTEFAFERDAGLVFTFTGDDDVWVFIDGKLVIDIGGVHSRVAQTIELDRLNWLEDGGTYSLDFFFAERHRTASNFRIETTLQLRNVELPPTAALYD